MQTPQEVDSTADDLKSFHRNFKLQLKTQQQVATASPTTSSNHLMAPPSQSNGRKRHPLVLRKFEEIYDVKEEVLGQGARSSVKLCSRRNSAATRYAVKIVSQRDETARKRVLREIEILYIGREHGNILHLIEYFEQQENFYLVFDKMDGGPLFQRIKQNKSFTEHEASSVVKELGSAIAFLHSKNIAHRDLKPENILCESIDVVTPVRICDFDLSYISHQRTPSTPILLTPVGSAEYMAPEVVEVYNGDNFTYDKKCDLWSLGVVLYIMLSGNVPFRGGCGRSCGWEEGKSCGQCHSILLDRIQNGEYDLPDKEWKHISKPAKDLVTNLLERNPDQRYSAVKVLNHSWITQKAPDTPLSTPTVLSRNNSFPHGLAQYASAANLFSRRLSNLGVQDDQDYCTGGERLSLSPPASSELVLRRRGNTPDPDM